VKLVKYLLEITLRHINNQRATWIMSL